jgi:hypothetical protein
MLDYRVVALYGWKIENKVVNNRKQNNVTNFLKKLQEWDENYYDDAQEIIVEDSMRGQYVYVGAIMAYFDPTEDDQVVILDDKELQDKAIAKFNKYIDEHPEFDEIFKKYKKGEPALYLFNHIW